MQALSPDEYAKLALPDQWIEDMMQEIEARWLIEQTQGCASVLELGFGSGIVTKALANAGRRVTVVDGSAELIAECSTIPCVVSVRSMFEDYEPKENFDCVIASFILEHVEDPVALLKRVRGWTEKLIVVIGNAESWHRRIAVQMGLQARLDSLSERDRIVGHHRVYDEAGIVGELVKAGWHPKVPYKGLMFKPLPNSMLAQLDRNLIRAMCEVEVFSTMAANVGIVCRPRGTIYE